MSKLHVCIVGAGIAGLRCANILLGKGVQVTILEARDRIGGRICQSNELGYSVDLGPQWIHTSGKNPLLHIANETNTSVHSWNGKTNLYNQAGGLVDSTKADHFSDLVWETVEEAMKYSREKGDEIPADRSLYNFYEEKAKVLFPEQEEEQKLFLKMSEVWGAYIGHPIQRQSLRFVWREHCCVGDEVIVTSTYSAILAKIAALPLSAAAIHFNKRVVSIESPGDARSASHQVVLRTDDKSNYSFDEVVLTTPLGWLKKNKSAFLPPLTAPLSQAIDHISVGNLEKAFITFPEAFWLSPEDEKEDVFPGYTNFLSPHYSPDQNPAGWSQEAYNLAAFPAPNKRPTLLFYTYGDCSHHIAKLSAAHTPTPGDATSHPAYQFFLPYVRLLPHYSASNPACKPAHILTTSWLLDDLAGNGSYINYQVGVEDATGDLQLMRDGMGADRKVWLAGEHTSPWEESGTATGAYLSGENIGNRVLEFNNLA